MDDRMGDNINGPSLIRVPEWIPHPLGKYYLYFAHHQGTYIRMAYADRLQGPWRVHHGGVLDLSDSFFDAHIASPDVHVLDDRHEIRMYFHGCNLTEYSNQTTRLVISPDGLNFTAYPELLGGQYWRAFFWKGLWYTLEMPGVFRRSETGVLGFEEGPTLFTPHMRHSAVQVKGDTLLVFYSNVYDCPERILWVSIALNSDWHKWQISTPNTLLTSETQYEGADCPVEPSQSDAIHHRVHQLRDPCIFEEEGKSYLLYSVAGEHGIAIGELTGN
jgi:hypothetical protein